MNRPVSIRVSATLLAATFCAAAALVLIHERPAAAGDDNPPAASRSFAIEMQRALKDLDLRLIALAAAVLEPPGIAPRVQDQLDRLKIDLIRAKGELEYARLKHEAAQISLKEFAEGIVPQEAAGAEADLMMGQSALVRAREMLKEAKTPFETVSAQLEEKKAGFSIEQAHSRKKVFNEYIRLKRPRELEAEVARADSEVRSKQAECDSLKRRITSLEKAAPNEPPSSAVRQRILALIDRALPIEERLQLGFERLRKALNPDAAAVKEMWSWAEELRSLIDEAEAVKAADDLAALKPRIQAVTRTPGVPAKP